MLDGGACVGQAFVLAELEFRFQPFDRQLERHNVCHAPSGALVAEFIDVPRLIASLFEMPHGVAQMRGRTVCVQRAWPAVAVDDREVPGGRTG
jgi:hypothetical protein